MIDNYFALEPVIVEALKNNIPEIETIHTPFSIEEMLGMTNEEVALSVIYFDDRVGDEAVKGRVNIIHQQWLVVLSLREASSQLQSTNEIRKKAEPYIQMILKTMQGLDPKLTGSRPFKRVNSPARSGGQSSFFYIPFMFESQLMIG